MFGAEHAGSGVDMVAHIIQAALTPVFLLSGIATLLNVFSTRLVRVADQVDAVSARWRWPTPPRAGFSAASCATFTGDPWRSMSRSSSARSAGRRPAARSWRCSSARCASGGSSGVLFGLFGLAVVCALGGVLAFTVEMLIAGIGIRDEVRQSRRSAMPRTREPGPSTRSASSGDGGRCPGEPAEDNACTVRRCRISSLAEYTAMPYLSQPGDDRVRPAERRPQHRVAWHLACRGRDAAERLYGRMDG